MRSIFVRNSTQLQLLSRWRCSVESSGESGAGGQSSAAAAERHQRDLAAARAEPVGDPARRGPTGDPPLHGRRRLPATPPPARRRRPRRPRLAGPRDGGVPVGAGGRRGTRTAGGGGHQLAVDGRLPGEAGRRRRPAALSGRRARAGGRRRQRQAQRRLLVLPLTSDTIGRHRMRRIGAAYCYRYRTFRGLCVGLCDGHTGEPCENGFNRSRYSSLFDGGCTLALPGEYD